MNLEENLPIRYGWLLQLLTLGLFTLASSPACNGGPTYLFPKDVDPKVTTLERKSGIRVTKKEWKSLQIQTTVWEIAQILPPKDRKVPIGTLAPIITIVKQRAFGIERRFDHIADSDLSVTVEHPTKAGRSITYSIEKGDAFVDGFSFNEKEELEPFSDEQIEKLKKAQVVSE